MFASLASALGLSLVYKWLPGDLLYTYNPYIEHNEVSADRIESGVGAAAAAAAAALASGATGPRKGGGGAEGGGKRTPPRSAKAAITVPGEATSDLKKALDVRYRIAHCVAVAL